MAFTYGFYNSLNHDRKYDALQLSKIFDGIIKDGVFGSIGKMLVVKESENDNEVIVQPGKAWFNHTWSENDADLPIRAEQSDLVFERIDAVVLDIDSSLIGRKNEIIFVKGTTSEENPQEPVMEHTDEHHQYPLAFVHRHPRQEHIDEADIQSCIGTDPCPLITGILETVDIEVLMGQWRAELDRFVQTKEDEFNTWSDAEKHAFVEWFENLTVQLDENTATNLAAGVENATTKRYEIESIPKDSWEEQEDGTYQKTFIFAGIREDTHFAAPYSIIDETMSKDDAEELSSALSCIRRIRPGIGQVTLICLSDVPDVDIPRLVLTEVR